MDRSPWKTKKKKWLKPKKTRNEWSRERIGGKFRETEGSHTLSFFRREFQRQRTSSKLWRIPNSIQPRTRYLTQAPSKIPPTHIYNEKMSSAFFKLFFLLNGVAFCIPPSIGIYSALSLFRHYIKIEWRTHSILSLSSQRGRVVVVIIITQQIPYTLNNNKHTNTLSIQEKYVSPPSTTTTLLPHRCHDNNILIIQ